MASFILASGSTQRQELLHSIGYTPAQIAPQDIDETPLKGERPRSYVTRITHDKLLAALKAFPEDPVLAADTIVAVGARILQKARDAEEQRQFLTLLSGRRHRLLTCVGVAQGNAVPPRLRVVQTTVHLKRLSQHEIDRYIESGVWQGCAGYNSNGFFQTFIHKIMGTTANMRGLPLLETRHLLESVGCFSTFI